MAVVREHLVVGGEIVEQGGGLDDDEGAPPAIPGMRVHKDAEIDAVASTPDLSEIEANAAKIAASNARRPAAAKGAPATKREKPTKMSTKGATTMDGVSDRRRCLELAVSSGETNPDEVLAIAGRYLAFLDGDSQEA